MFAALNDGKNLETQVLEIESASIDSSKRHSIRASMFSNGLDGQVRVDRCNMPLASSDSRVGRRDVRSLAAINFRTWTSDNLLPDGAPPEYRGANTWKDC